MNHLPGSNVTIELAQRNDISGNTGSAKWRNELADNILIEPGDMLEIQQCLLNTENVSNSNIVISEDTTITLEMGFYETVFNQDVFTTGDKANQLRAQCTVPRDNTGGGSASYSIPAISNDGDKTYTENQQRTDDYKYFVLRKCPEQNGAFDNWNWFAPRELFTQTYNYTIKAGTYTPQGLADLISKDMSESESFIYRVPTDGDDTSPPRTQEHMFSLDPTDVYNIDPNEEPDTFPVQYKYKDKDNHRKILGATQTSLQFDSNGTFNLIAHTPIFKSSSALEPAVTQIKTYWNDGADQFKYTEFKQQSGVFFTKMEPASFWEDLLGFDTSAMINTDIQSVNNEGYADTRVTPSDFEKVITGAFFGNQQKVDNGWELSAVDNEKSNKITTYLESNMDPLVAVRTYEQDTKGYYNISISNNLSTNNYYSSSGRRPDIFANVSLQYNNNNWVTADTSGSVPYLHLGAPEMLSSFDVEIQDPNTNQAETGLGNNSVIFLKLTKGAAGKSK